MIAPLLASSLLNFHELKWLSHRLGDAGAGSLPFIQL